MRCTLNGALADGVSKNHVRILTYVAYSGVDVLNAGRLHSGRERAQCQIMRPQLWQVINGPLPRWRWTRELASNDCPVRNIQPQPVSLVHTFSPEPGQKERFGGFASRLARSLPLQADRGQSCMGEKWERYVSQTREVKSA